MNKIPIVTFLQFELESSNKIVKTTYMTKPQGRLQFIDLHRGLAILVMIEVHVFNAFIIPSMKFEPWFHHLNFVNGLVAPSFTFISGFAFILAAEKKMEEFKKFGSAFWKQLGRIAMIWFVGYTLRVPFFSLQRSLHESSTQQIEAFFSVDVLQTIAIGLLMLFGIRMLIRNTTAFKLVVFGLFLFFGLAAPWFWQHDFHSHIPIFFASYLNPSHGSLFPLFPWVGFIFAGAAACLLFISARDKGKMDEFFKYSALVSGVLIITGHLCIAKSTFSYIPMPDPHFFFFTMRIGYVLMVLVVCQLISQYFDVTKIYIVDASRESLLLYWLHLQLIYRKWATNQSLADIINGSFGIWLCILATLAMIALMLVVAIYWGRLKKNNFPLARYTSWAFVGIPLVIFLLR
ncbi:MAG: DUF1624 domain-containing protein [Ignavibacteria bacterium]|nr:DUF1624 domain-containing protein [Ignavibacteria bacterium]